LKASIFHYKNTLIWLVAVAFVFAAASCSDNEENGTGPGGSVTIQTIILNPKSAEPGDTVQATVVLTGGLPPGTFPTVEWSANGGTFLADDAVSVGWVAPTASGVFRLTCKVISPEKTDIYQADVSVGQTSVVIPADAGELHLIPSTDNFFYLHNVGEEGAWDSSSVYKYEGSGAPVGASARKGAQFAFSDAPYPYAAFVAIDTMDSGNTEDPINVFLVNLNTGAQTRVSADKSLPGGTRHHQYVHPYFSPDDSKLTFQGFLPHVQAGLIDTLDVFEYDIQTGQTINVTDSDVQSERRQNILPTYSTDYTWLVFASDRQFRSEWDLFGAPISNGVVDTQLSSVVQITTGGMIGTGIDSQLGRVILEWNPVQSIIAVVGGEQSDDYLHIVHPPGGGAPIDVLDTGDAIVEVLWSPSGQDLAVSSLVQDATATVVNALFTVTPSGVVTQRHTAMPGDRIVDLAWSPDGQFMLYRLIRGTGSWFELIDIDAGTDLLAPIVITQTGPLGNRSTYAAEMRTNSQIGVNLSGDTVAYMLVFGDVVTPSVSMLDVTGTMQP
jgi:Tol biopolymer transport system component